MKYDISFIGLGKLGLPLATNFAKCKKKVLAIDLNTKLINNLKKGTTPWIEPDLEDNIKNSTGYITYTDSYDEV